MSNKKRIEKLEQTVNTGEELIEEIIIEIINPDGTTVEKKINGVWGEI